MDLIFITGSVEPGCDGVGDYARCLALALRDRGVTAGLLSLADGPQVGVREETQDALACLRLSRALPWAERMARASAWVAARQPAWVSLQFVPFAFDSRGLFWGLGRRLRRMGGSCRWHLMFHELGIGLPLESPLKHRILGRVQRLLIRDLLRTLAPAAVHTQCTLYVQALASYGVRAERLPLFSTFAWSGERASDPSPPNGPSPEGVPAADSSRGESSPALAALLARVGLGWMLECRPSLWIITHFGTLHPEFDPQALAGAILPAADAAGRKVVLVFMGNVGSVGRLRVEELKRFCGLRAMVQSVGFLAPQEVSLLLALSDYALTSYPADLIEKSSSVAPALQEGLPVLVARRPVTWPPSLGPVPLHPLLIPDDRLDRLGEYGRLPGGGEPTARTVAARLAESLGLPLKSP